MEVLGAVQPLTGAVNSSGSMSRRHWIPQMRAKVWNWPGVAKVVSTCVQPGGGEATFALRGSIVSLKVAPIAASVSGPSKCSVTLSIVGTLYVGVFCADAMAPTSRRRAASSVPRSGERAHAELAGA